jgi:hypothetical protein
MRSIGLRKIEGRKGSDCPLKEYYTRSSLKLFLTNWPDSVALITMATPDDSNDGERKLACPYFMPVERFENGQWQHPARLPLGGGWRGHCTAPGHAGEVPAEHILESLCNLGYAGECVWAPNDRSWDGIRFSVCAPISTTTGASPDAALRAPVRILGLRYVCERNNLPAEHGVLEFDLSAAVWRRRHEDVRLQKMAECYLDSYLAKKA